MMRLNMAVSREVRAELKRQELIEAEDPHLLAGRGRRQGAVAVCRELRVDDG